MIRGNAAILKCSIPSFVGDFVNVISWQDEAGNSFTYEENKEGDGTICLTKYNILIPKCLQTCQFLILPKIQRDAFIAVVTQYYEAEVVSEYVIRGNTAVLKCNIPSFVADFVKVEAWVNSEGGEYLPTDDIGSSDLNNCIT